MPGKRYSRQREMIHQCLMNTAEHPTAEMVYSTLKPENPNLSLGTVYRNLNLLAEEGVITRMPFSVDRYDANTMPHAHFRCKSCGKVYDMMNLPYDNTLNDVATQHCGHLVDRHDVVFSGTCTDCIPKH